MLHAHAVSVATRFLVQLLAACLHSRGLIMALCTSNRALDCEVRARALGGMHAYVCLLCADRTLRVVRLAASCFAGRRASCAGGVPAARSARAAAAKRALLAACTPPRLPFRSSCCPPGTCSRLQPPACTRRPCCSVLARVCITFNALPPHPLRRLHRGKLQVVRVSCAAPRRHTTIASATYLHLCLLACLRAAPKCDSPCVQVLVSTARLQENLSAGRLRIAQVCLPLPIHPPSPRNAAAQRVDP